MTDTPVLTSQLVSTQWLADHLGTEGLLVVDASVAAFTRPDGRSGYLSGHEQYLLEGHVPGAVFADLIEEFSDPEGDYPFTRPDAERFAAAAGALGVGPGTTVVAYDTAVGQWASRLWWLFRAFGYDDVAVLDGGLAKWRAEGRELGRGHIEPTPAEFTASERPELWVSKQDVEAVVRGEREAALVCSTPPKEFSGEAVTRVRAGHIPGSSSAPAGFLVDRETNALLDAEGLRARLAPALGAPQIITYCGGGIAATSAAFALTLLGERAVAVYDGSLNEWAADPDAPLVTAD
ncbi:sulfurtransferase [Protaetiibacter intestinalis]|uniref:Sulfurtransferase n=1 Tax=Protaetiibacter intestinalis TaxID=2419774 RepID=A0A387B4C8_9MICO|nr:rhodanese-like domain-containing protein [Protaetiibacter intestinalis]AYF97273.1 sulfurtransferase [Protaetiibacter intestinalis]